MNSTDCLVLGAKDPVSRSIRDPFPNKTGAPTRTKTQLGLGAKFLMTNHQLATFVAP